MSAELKEPAKTFAADSGDGPQSLAASVEQYLTHALAVADLCYVLARGRVAFVGDRGEMRRAELVSDVYLGDTSVRAGGATGP